jgi:hypothetical protein
VEREDPSPPLTLGDLMDVSTITTLLKNPQWLPIDSNIFQTAQPRLPPFPLFSLTACRLRRPGLCIYPHYAPGE